MTEAGHKLGEVLRAAREAKGVDLPRVERETKIRERYLSALERGEYRELPGAVYTKGFLRNYGAYLGLDPEYLIDLYRLETAATSSERATAVAAAPRPLAVKRSRAFVVTPGAIMSVILTILVVAFIAYLGFELVNFARQPELRITTPAGNVSGHTELTITVRGETEPNAVVTFSELRENPTVTADATGAFEVTVSLVHGSNVMRVVARDPETGRDSEVEERTIIVDELGPSPTVAPVALTVSEPVADATSGGPIGIAGTAVPGGSVTVNATLDAPPTPSFTIADATNSPVEVRPAAPAVPEPLVLAVDAGGAFAGTLPLPAGRWVLSFAPESGEPVTRRVTIGPPEMITVRLELEGGDSWMDISVDGTPVDGLSGGLAVDGRAIDLSARDELTILAGNAGAVSVTVDGIDIGTMGADGSVVEWRVTRGG